MDLFCWLGMTGSVVRESYRIPSPSELYSVDSSVSQWKKRPLVPCHPCSDHTSDDALAKERPISVSCLQFDKSWPNRLVVNAICRPFPNSPPLPLIDGFLNFFFTSLPCWRRDHPFRCRRLRVPLQSECAVQPAGTRNSVFG